MSNQVDRWDQLSNHHPDASVIDPNDLRGFKNRYISLLRNASILEAVRIGSDSGIVLDFGCGTGGLSKALVDSGHAVVGVDISMGLLRRVAERQIGGSNLFVRYDGFRLPLANESITSAVTWVVLNYLIEEAELRMALNEIHRVLRPGGRLVAIEQVRSRQTLDLTNWQCRRTLVEFTALFESAGFVVANPTIVRYGRFPTTFAVRLGWVAERFFPRLRAMERWVGRQIGLLPWDYSEARFILTKY